MNLGIVGSRNRNTDKDKLIIRHQIHLLKPDKIISGGCSQGADKFAEELAEELGIPIKIFYPELIGCKKYYDYIRAYYSRNKKVANASDKLLALVTKDRKGGTENTIRHFLVNHSDEDLILK